MSKNIWSIIVFLFLLITNLWQRESNYKKIIDRLDDLELYMERTIADIEEVKEKCDEIKDKCDDIKIDLI